MSAGFRNKSVERRYIRKPILTLFGTIRTFSLILRKKEEKKITPNTADFKQIPIVYSAVDGRAKKK